MKELSVEEKAKCYDEALRKAKEVLDDTNDDYVCTYLTKNDIKEMYANLLPELKESDDEMIRTKLLNLLKELLELGGVVQDTWSMNDCEQFIAWLEKLQIEKLPFEMKTPEESLGIDSDTYNKVVDECIYGEQKPVDKSEPKFKVGDWIIHNKNIKLANSLMLVAGKNYNNEYLCRYRDGQCSYDIEFIDKKYRLWTINDAKDGDVLFTSSTASHETFIFKSIDENGNIECYFAYDSEDGFREGKYHFIGKPTFMTYPATREQRDLLFQKMRESGYKWDTEKKELKKIEQKSADWSADDLPEFKSYLCLMFQKFRTKGVCTNGEIVDFVKEHSQKLKDTLCHAWSKEDETLLNCCLGAINTTDYFDKDNKDKMKDWLYNRFKFLKPQNRWNDISVSPKFPCDILFKYPNGNKFIFHYLENGRKNSAETPIFSSLEEGEWIYLDDIEPQSHWKPSDKQMEVMSYLAKYYAVSIDEPNRSIIISLYEDLQKLMKK